MIPVNFSGLERDMGRRKRVVDCSGGQNILTKAERDLAAAAC